MGFAGKKESGRADSNRLPLLQLRVCGHWLLSVAQACKFRIQRVASILTCPQDDVTSADQTSPSLRLRMLHDAMWVTFTETRCR